MGQGSASAPKTRKIVYPTWHGFSSLSALPAPAPRPPNVQRSVSQQILSDVSTRMKQCDVSAATALTGLPARDVYSTVLYGCPDVTSLAGLSKCDKALRRPYPLAGHAVSTAKPGASSLGSSDWAPSPIAPPLYSPSLSQQHSGLLQLLSVPCGSRGSPGAAASLSIAGGDLVLQGQPTRGWDQGSAVSYPAPTLEAALEQDDVDPFAAIAALIERAAHDAVQQEILADAPDCTVSAAVDPKGCAPSAGVDDAACSSPAPDDAQRTASPKAQPTPRLGADAPTNQLLHLFAHSGCPWVAAEDRALCRSVLQQLVLMVEQREGSSLTDALVSGGVAPPPSTDALGSSGVAAPPSPAYFEASWAGPVPSRDSLGSISFDIAAVSLAAVATHHAPLKTAEQCRVRWMTHGPGINAAPWGHAPCESPLANTFRQLLEKNPLCCSLLPHASLFDSGAACTDAVSNELALVSDLIRQHGSDFVLIATLLPFPRSPLDVLSCYSRILRPPLPDPDPSASAERDVAKRECPRNICLSPFLSLRGLRNQCPVDLRIIDTTPRLCHFDADSSKRGDDPWSFIENLRMLCCYVAYGPVWSYMRAHVHSRRSMKGTRSHFTEQLQRFVTIKPSTVEDSSTVPAVDSCVDFGEDPKVEVSRKRFRANEDFNENVDFGVLAQRFCEVARECLAKARQRSTYRLYVRVYSTLGKEFGLFPRHVRCYLERIAQTNEEVKAMLGAISDIARRNVTADAADSADGGLQKSK